ncbi:MAG: methylamine utilization protein [Cyanobacteria bacterium NC_groundwater_1444_Ag_S-0.65um_54_12]|nr:methylamine utilization protein [Cyanobacteria bacterium NC_groundwater_1444_Ag_S-0.65um_54_12]
MRMSTIGHQVKESSQQLLRICLGICCLTGSLIVPLAAQADMEPVKIVQKNLKFIPGTITVEKGTEVSFPNEDQLFHSVFSESPGNTFDLGSYPRGVTKSVKLEKAGAVEVKCHLHPKMKMIINVVEPGKIKKAFD